jgi:hypothetical protein
MKLRKLFGMAVLLVATALTSWVGINSARADDDATWSAPNHRGTVRTILKSGEYIYLEVEEQGQVLWIGVMETPVALGDVVEFSDSPPMINFISKGLNRTFPEMRFVPGIRRNPTSESTTEDSARP